MSSAAVVGLDFQEDFKVPVLKHALEPAANTPRSGP